MTSQVKTRKSTKKQSILQGMVNDAQADHGRAGFVDLSRKYVALVVKRCKRPDGSFVTQPGSGKDPEAVFYFYKIRIMEKLDAQSYGQLALPEMEDELDLGYSKEETQNVLLSLYPDGVYKKASSSGGQAPREGDYVIAMHDHIQGRFLIFKDSKPNSRNEKPPGSVPDYSTLPGNDELFKNGKPVPINTTPKGLPQGPKAGRIELTSNRVNFECLHSDLKKDAQDIADEFASLQTPPFPTGAPAPLYISSAYRSTADNTRVYKALGESENRGSWHKVGAAFDIDPNNYSPIERAALKNAIAAVKKNRDGELWHYPHGNHHHMSREKGTNGRKHYEAAVDQDKCSDENLDKFTENSSTGTPITEDEK